MMTSIPLVIINPPPGAMLSATLVIERTSVLLLFTYASLAIHIPVDCLAPPDFLGGSSDLLPARNGIDEALWSSRPQASR